MKNNKLNQVNEIYKILNPEYFHICVENNENNAIKWSIFYKNLSEEDYYSERNKPLLTSEKNVPGDIYQLNKNFEKEKNKIFNNNIFDYMKFNFECFDFKLKIKQIFYFIVIEISVLTFIIASINLFMKNNLWSSSIPAIFSVSILIISQHNLKKLDKLLDKLFNKKSKEFYIKTLTRNFEFMERLKLWNWKCYLAKMN